MPGLKGRVVAKLPSALLRTIFGLLYSGSDGGDRSVKPASSIRRRNYQAAVSVVTGGTAGIVHAREKFEPVIEVRGISATERLEMRRRLEEQGFRVKVDPEAMDSDIQWLVFIPSKLGESFDRAFAVRVVLRETADNLSPTDALAITFNIDVVYTWVDGNDPLWKVRRTKAKVSDIPSMPSADDEARFTSHDELKYSLRSIDYFAPWVRRIHIVTAGQIPPWLNTRDPRINIVNHADIFENPSNLPTFNSHAIESQLHRVPGLSEHFIYMNDDVFLGQPLSPSSFFTPTGDSRFFTSKELIRRSGTGGLPVDVAAENNRAIIESRFGRSTSRKMKHTPHAQLRSTLETINEEQTQAVASTAGAQFRSTTDLSIPSSLAHYYGLCLGKSIPSDIGYGYIDLSDSNAQIKLLRMLRRGCPETFCINQVTSDTSTGVRKDRMIRHFLKRAFPIPSAFEVT